MMSLPEPNENFAPLMLNGERTGCLNSDPNEDHSYVGCLGQTRVSATRVAHGK